MIFTHVNSETRSYPHSYLFTPTPSHISPNVSPSQLHVLRQGFSYSGSHAFKLGWLAGKPHMSCSLCLSSAMITSVHHAKIKKANRHMISGDPTQVPTLVW